MIGVLIKFVLIVVVLFWFLVSGLGIVYVVGVCFLFFVVFFLIVVLIGGVFFGLVIYGVFWEFNGLLFEFFY